MEAALMLFPREAAAAAAEYKMVTVTQCAY